ncbi:hypothetical protein ACFLU5_14760 [Bacteroidota bacterium]
MKSYRLDKTAFKHHSLQEADHSLEYWHSKTHDERLQASWYLICTSYGIPYDKPPRLDKTCFTTRRHS